MGRGRGRGRGLIGKLGTAACLFLALLAPATAQVEQRIEVTIKDYTFVTKQVPLMLDTPTLIAIKNEDAVRHDFGSAIFHGSLTRIESGGVISYGRGVEGVFLDPGRETAIRFIIERPGRYQFKCSIHPDMKGELLLMSVGAV
jgi:plastocyanin